jgi:hypothetical protein
METPMQLLRPLLIGTSLAAALAAFIPAADAAILDRAGVYVSYWQATIDGEARIDGPTPGMPYDLNQALGLDVEDGVKEIGAWFHPIGRHRLRVSAFDGSFDGRPTIVDPFPIDGVILPPAVPVTPAVDLKLYKGHYNYAFVNLDLVNVGGLIGIDYVDAENRLEALGTTYSADLKGGVPVLGINVQVAPAGFFRAYGEATYANWEVGGLDASIRDVAVRAEFYFAHFFGLGAGYRSLKMEIEDEDEGRLDTKLDGYQLFLLFRF